MLYTGFETIVEVPLHEQKPGKNLLSWCCKAWLLFSSFSQICHGL